MGGRKNQSIENLPMNISAVTPTPKPNAQSITQLVEHNGRIEGYQLSGGQVILKEQGVEPAKVGAIRGVAVVARNGSEYPRSLPDDEEGDNLGNLPSISQ